MLPFTFQDLPGGDLDAQAMIAAGSSAMRKNWRGLVKHISYRRLS